MSDQVLQILPRSPGSRDGVGDYAVSLARFLRDDHGMVSVFAVNRGPVTDLPGNEFEIRLGLPDPGTRKYERLIVHYANYGYDRFGIPSQLINTVRAFRRNGTSRCVTMFHEIYASGPPWRSAFWTRPFQVKAARDLIRCSTACIASNSVIRDEIRKFDPQKPVSIVPIGSNFGEGEPVRPKELLHWVICGGTALIERSLKSLLRHRDLIPHQFFPARLDVIGGEDSAAVSQLMTAAGQALPNVKLQHHAAVSAGTAAELLSTASWGYMDYFGTGRVWLGMVFKSSSFAAFYAHGVIPIMSHVEERLSLDGDDFPGPFFCSENGQRFPEERDLESIREKLRSWYKRHASARHTAAVYAEALR